MFLNVCKEILYMRTSQEKQNGFLIKNLCHISRFSNLHWFTFNLAFRNIVFHKKFLLLKYFIPQFLRDQKGIIDEERYIRRTTIFIFSFRIGFVTQFNGSALGVLKHHYITKRIRELLIGNSRFLIYNSLNQLLYYTI